MIPVELQPEPADFDENVRLPGRAWLAARAVEPDAPPPDPAALPTYWRRSNRQLWEAYDGVCAYLAIHFEWVTETHSTDHFVAKSRNAGDAYEWRNYRLSCLAANRNKGRFDFARYVNCRDEQILREWSPFVWREARRQNLL